MKRYLYRLGGAWAWCYEERRLPKGAQAVRELPGRCTNPRCRTRGGVTVLGDGTAKCAECGVKLT